jgi:dolichol-phosphate mannosyltransferase
VTAVASTGKSSIFTLAFFRSFIKFNVVGLTGVFVNEGLLIVLHSMGVYVLTASAIAIEASILSNFVLNDFWTFRDRRSGHLVVRLVKFNLLMLLGLLVNLAIIYAATTYYGIAAELANLGGIGAAFLLRYGLSVKYAWMREESIEGAQAVPVSEPIAGPRNPPADEGRLYHG